MLTRCKNGSSAEWRNVGYRRLGGLQLFSVPEVVRCLLPQLLPLSPLFWPFLPPFLLFSPLCFYRYRPPYFSSIFAAHPDCRPGPLATPLALDAVSQTCLKAANKFFENFI